MERIAFCTNGITGPAEVVRHGQTNLLHALFANLVTPKGRPPGDWTELRWLLTELD